jgi:hypothetical protein
MSAGMPLFLANQSIVQPATASLLGFEASFASSLKEDARSASTAVYYYPGEMHFPAATIQVRLTSADANVAGNFHIGEYTGAGVTPVAGLTAAFDLNTGAQVLSIVIASPTVVNNPVLYLQQTTGVVDSLDLQIDFDLGATAYTNGWTIIPKSIFDLLGPDAALLEAQWNRAAQWRPIATSVRFAQTSSVLRLGGSVSACQMPGGSVSSIPGTPETLYNYAGGRQDLAYRAESFKKGIHSFIIKEKLEDLEFRRRVSNKAIQRFQTFDHPYQIIAYQKEPDDLGAFTTMKLSGELFIAWETKTADLSATLEVPVAMTVQELQCISLAIAQAHPFSENPNHANKIKNIFKRVWNDPEVKRMTKVATDSGKSWLKQGAMAALPLVLGAMI